MIPRTFNRKATPTKAGLRQGLNSVLQWRDNLDTLDVEGAARSYGIAPAEVRRLIAEERNRRAGRGLG